MYLLDSSTSRALLFFFFFFFFFLMFRFCCFWNEILKYLAQLQNTAFPRFCVRAWRTSWNGSEPRAIDYISQSWWLSVWLWKGNKSKKNHWTRETIPWLDVGPNFVTVSSFSERSKWHSHIYDNMNNLFDPAYIVNQIHVNTIDRTCRRLWFFSFQTFQQNKVRSL